MELIDGLFSATVLIIAWFTAKKAIVEKLFSPEDEPVKKEVLVCMRCASRNISALKHMKHWLKRYGPVMGVYTCQECGYEGLPMSLNSDEDYKAYRDLLGKD